MRAGAYVKAVDVQQQFGAVAARMLSAFEASFMPIANAIAASRAQTPHDILRTMRLTWREVRAQAGQGARRGGAGPCRRWSMVTPMLLRRSNGCRRERRGRLGAAACLDLLAWAERNIVFDDGPFRGPIAGRCSRSSIRSYARSDRMILAASSR